MDRKNMETLGAWAGVHPSCNWYNSTIIDVAETNNPRWQVLACMNVHVYGKMEHTYMPQQAHSWVYDASEADVIIREDTRIGVDKTKSNFHEWYVTR